IKGAGDSVRDMAAQSMDNMRDVTAHGIESVRATTAQGIEQAASAPRRAMDALRHGNASSLTDMHRKLSDVLERQPLAVGALGLAIGAGLAAAFPTSSI